MCELCEIYHGRLEREERGRETASHRPHKPETLGSTPSPATNDCCGGNPPEGKMCQKGCLCTYIDGKIHRCGYHLPKEPESAPLEKVDFAKMEKDAFYRIMYGGTPDHLQSWDLCPGCVHPRKVGLIACASERCECRSCHLHTEFKVMIPRNHGRTDMLRQLEMMKGYIPRTVSEWTTATQKREEPQIDIERLVSRLRRVLKGPKEFAFDADYQYHRGALLKALRHNLGEDTVNGDEERRSSDEEHSPVTREVTGSSPAGAATDTFVHPPTNLIEWWAQEFDRLTQKKQEPEPFWKDNYGRTYATVQDITTEHLKNIVLYLEGRMRQARPNRGAKHYFKWLAVRNEIRRRKDVNKVDEDLLGSPFGRPTEERRASEAVEPPKLHSEGSTPSASASDEIGRRLNIEFVQGQLRQNAPEGEDSLYGAALEAIGYLKAKYTAEKGMREYAERHVCCMEVLEGGKHLHAIEEDEEMPEFLIGWTDDETAVEDLAAIITAEFDRQADFGMSPSTVDIAAALVEAFKFQEEIEEGQEMFSPWRKDENGRSDGV